MAKRVDRREPSRPDDMHGLTRGMRARYEEAKGGRPAMSAHDGRHRPVLPAEAARAELERLRSGEGGQSDPDHMLRDTAPMAAMAAAPVGYAAMTGTPLPAAGALMAAPVVAGSAKGLARDVKRGVPLHESRYLLPVAMTAAAGTRFAGREVAGNLRHIAGGGPRAILPVGPNGMGNVARAGLSTAELEAMASRFPGENVDMHFVRPALTAEGRAMLDADATLVDRMYAALARRRAPHATVGRLLKGRDAEVLAAAYPRTVGRTRVDVRPRAADSPLGEVLPRGRGQSIVLYRDVPPGRSMAPTFGHEFKHVLETQEPFAGGGAGSRSNPVVKRLAEDAVALASAEERGAAYGRALKNMAYATSAGENTARAVGLMNETGSLSWRDLLRNPRKHIDFGNGGTVMIDTKDNPGYPVYVSGADLQPATSRYRGPVPPDQLDDKGGKGEDRFSMSRNFLATDKVPDTIFGIPVVSRKEDYTEADLRFFQEHPEAGGYYDLGEETPEDGSAEGAPTQADEAGIPVPPEVAELTRDMRERYEAGKGKASMSARTPNTKALFREQYRELLARGGQGDPETMANGADLLTTAAKMSSPWSMLITTGIDLGATLASGDTAKLKDMAVPLAAGLVLHRILPGTRTAPSTMEFLRYDPANPEAVPTIHAVPLTRAAIGKLSPARAGVLDRVAALFTKNPKLVTDLLQDGPEKMELLKWYPKDAKLDLANPEQGFLGVTQVEQGVPYVGINKSFLGRVHADGGHVVEPLDVVAHEAGAHVPQIAARAYGGGSPDTVWHDANMGVLKAHMAKSLPAHSDLANSRAYHDIAETVKSRYPDQVQNYRPMGLTENQEPTDLSIARELLDAEVRRTAYRNIAGEIHAFELDRRSANPALRSQPIPPLPKGALRFREQGLSNPETRQDTKGGKARGKYPGSLNNPGNVEKRRTRRAGEVDSPHDRWAKFDTPQNGLAASAAVVREIAESKLAAERKPFTIRNYAEKYAPRSENDTDSYIRNLSRYSGIGADDVLDLWDTDAMSRLLRAKVRFESGVPHSQWFTDDEYRAAAGAMKEGAID